MSQESENFHNKLVDTYYESARWKKILDSEYKNASHEYNFFPRNATENVPVMRPSAGQGVFLRFRVILSIPDDARRFPKTREDISYRAIVRLTGSQFRLL
jgi:hypothetical protein